MYGRIVIESESSLILCPYPGPMVGRPQRKKTPLFGGRLSTLRKERGLTQAQLAGELGLSPKMVDYYERRCTNPSMDFVKEVARFFDVSVAFLVVDNVAELPRKSPPPRSRIEEQMERLRALPKTEQTYILRTVSALIRDAEQRSR